MAGDRHQDIDCATATDFAPWAIEFVIAVDLYIFMFRDFAGWESICRSSPALRFSDPGGRRELVDFTLVGFFFAEGACCR